MAAGFNIDPTGVARPIQIPSDDSTPIVPKSFWGSLLGYRIITDRNITIAGPQPIEKMRWYNGVRYVLDTHVLIGPFTGNRRLLEVLENRIDQVRQQGRRLLVPTMVLGEALAIAAKGRVTFDFDRLYRVMLTEPEFRIREFGLGIFDEVLRIKQIPEHHDQIIAAMARFYGAHLLTFPNKSYANDMTVVS